jgi:hypothetical protein
MNNKEILEKLGESFAGLVNNTISIKEANATIKEADSVLKQQRKELANFKRLLKIAQKRNETFATEILGETTLYGIPAENKSFYFEPGIEPEGSFVQNGAEFLVVYKSVALDC